MKLLQPAFWSKDASKPVYWFFLWLASGLYYLGTLCRRMFTHVHKLPLKSICVGNAVAGGAGKTPTLLALAHLLQETEIVFLTRGYGGKIKIPTLVDETHGHADVGDEALLLAAYAPTIVARDRLEGAKLAAHLFPECLLLLDDGLQNPKFRANLNILVWDEFGAGNGHMIPAGPLRLPLNLTLKMTDLVITINDTSPPKTPAFSAHGQIHTSISARQDVCAFAGIGRPEKFKKSLLKAGFHVCQFGIFQDHHAYTEEDLLPYIHPNTITLTTEKDFVRVPPSLRDKINPVPYVIEFGHPQALLSWIRNHLK